MDFPLEIFGEIYVHCIPETVYALSITCSSLNILMRDQFKTKKPFAVHKRVFKPLLELLDTTDYWISDNGKISIYYAASGRKIGYRSYFKYTGCLHQFSKIREVVITASDGPYWDENCRGNMGDYPMIDFYNEYIYVHNGAVNLDPEDDRFYEFPEFSGTKHIILY
ncbi:Hypothetical protein PACV_121 [Pacmanvirus A23]|uniref:Hypothetical protein n=1 Tax=Pacmanvirus A23 TaxID=1932881 RepID=UPI000A092A66|nr:Hypothetical protein B9W72_gp120 [Pacmanvirus A23]SIP85837.1 Hypothetical protein PACV_121 [Pacmanvirus A23]